MFLGTADMSPFRNCLPLTKMSQAPEEENGEQRGQPLVSSQYPQEAALQVTDACSPAPQGPFCTSLQPTGHANSHSCPQATVLGLVALSKAHPAALAPGTAALVTPTSPWPCPLP